MRVKLQVIVECDVNTENGMQSHMSALNEELQGMANSLLAGAQKAAMPDARKPSRIDRVQLVSWQFRPV